MIAAERPPHHRDREDVHAWLEDVFASLRSAIGGDSQQTGCARECGAGRFAYDVEDDGVAFMITVENVVRRHRRFARSIGARDRAAEIAPLLLERYRGCSGQGEPPKG